MVMIVSHRGARNLWPENSLDGFRRTIALGVEAVEFDLHLSRDGEIMVIHDPTLERTTVGTGLVAARTARELAAIALRDGDGEGVPTLDQVLDLFAPTTMELQVEIKTDALGRPYPGLEQRAIDAILRRGLESRAMLTCFVPDVLETVRRLRPSMPVLASVNRGSAEMLGGIERALARFDAISGCLVAVEHTLLASCLELCRARIGGERLGAWTPNTPELIAHWMAQPIRQLTTDRPDLALATRR